MTKKELIEVSYLKYVSKEVYENTLKEYIDMETGWATTLNVTAAAFESIFAPLYKVFQTNGYKMRPKELKGLEHNNGWNCMSIEIPKEVHNSKLVLRFANGEIKPFGAEFSFFNMATHWRIVEPWPQPLWNDEFTEFYLTEANG